MSPGATLADPAVLLDHVCATVRVRSVQRADLVGVSFVTGSYVAGHWDRRRPSLNVYFIATAHRADDLRLELSRWWRDLAGQLAAAGWELLIDCHPYTVSQRSAAAPGGRLLTITTKVLESEHRAIRYRLPPTIGPGWCGGLRVLHGDPAEVMILAEHPRRTAEWARTMHRALSHYRNVLDHLPWALPWRERPQLLVEESSRYAEEAFKDSLSFRLTAAELADGEHMRLLSDWAVRAREFIAARLGADGLRAADTVARLKAARDEDPSIEEAQGCWRDGKEVWEWAWGQYLVLADELLPGQPDFHRVDAFV
ncbi:hypothetical protein [Plantactinospora sp. KBS50]|uniref:hypothetical protein n=1 Tax=Plantactinospora sp. KBS50 TaxID=2024580 RepID=UPI0012FDF1A7|nr:hypothetical protein [Plantactinospora sp. KBS50]